eukprot:25674_1
MRDTLDITGFNSHEISPLIPDPPIKQPRVKQRSHCCHQCWSRFTCCSKWSCLFVIILIIVTILIIVRSVLPFGWPWWIPSIQYDPTDPHIVIIVADDIGWGDLGYGGAEFPTTNIDQLRQAGISLNRMYAHQSGSATRAALLTGIPGYTLGLQNGIDTGSGAHIPLDAQLLPEILKRERGYATHAVGKWALGYSRWAYTPTYRGFDSFVGFFQRYIDYWHYSATIEGNLNALKSASDPLFVNKNNEMLMGYDLWKDSSVYNPSTKMQYATELLDDHITQVLDEHADGLHPEQPMLLYYTPPNAHAPIQYHYEYDNECSYIRETSELIRWKYCNLMQELDASIGQLVNKLKEKEMWERTVLVFTSDNGGLMCYDVGSVNTCSGSVNLPLRGGKGTLFEGSLRVRSIVSGGYIDESVHGQTSEQLMHSADLFSTLLEAANVDHDIIYYNENVAGLPFWHYLNTNGEDFLPPQRDKPFVADMSFDASTSYIEKAALFWKGYKYIIQPVAAYDGWWKSPLEGTEEIPSNSEGISCQPEPLPKKDSNPQLNLQQDLDTDSVSWTSLRMNEYLFKIDEDYAETDNVRGDDANDEILQELRSFLESLAAVSGAYEAQDSSTSVNANPSKFGNVWYPFEE